MEIWCDSANTTVVTSMAAFGFMAGITTNPKILSQQPLLAEQQITQLLAIQSGPVAVQVTATQVHAMVTQAKKLHELSSRIIVKIPMTEAGIKALPQLKNSHIPTLATAVFGADQFLLAAKLGAQYVAPYLHQMQQHNIDVYRELNLMQEMIQHYGFSTKVMAAGIQDFADIKPIAKLGVGAITLPEGCFAAWLQTHPLTAQGTQILNTAWAPFAKSYAGALFADEEA